MIQYVKYAGIFTLAVVSTVMVYEMGEDTPKPKKEEISISSEKLDIERDDFLESKEPVSKQEPVVNGQVIPNGQPIIIEKDNNSLTDALTYGTIGYMLGNSGSSNYNSGSSNYNYNDNYRYNDNYNDNYKAKKVEKPVTIKKVETPIITKKVEKSWKKAKPQKEKNTFIGVAKKPKTKSSGSSGGFWGSKKSSGSSSGSSGGFWGSKKSSGGFFGGSKSRSFSRGG